MAKLKYAPPCDAEIIQEIKARATQKLPNCEIIQTVVIKRGPKTYKTASVLQFKSPEAEEVTRAVTLGCLTKTYRFAANR